MMGKKNFVRYCSHNQKDPGSIYDLQSSFTNMIYETKITKSPNPAKMWSTFIVRLKLPKI